MKRRPRKTGGVPVLKLPPNRLGPVAVALRGNEYNRDGFKHAVLELFAADKEEKSVFRGMAIPTLRALGLLLGFEMELRLSADGALVAAGTDTQSLVPMAHLLVEIESELDLHSAWAGPEQAAATTVADRLCQVDTPDGTPTSETKRRVMRWLQYLEFFGVCRQKNGRYSRVEPPKGRGLTAKAFAEQLVSAYRSLSPKTIGEPAVSIDETARALSLSCFDKGVVMTRRRFDKYLGLCIESGDVDVHLHKSMGAGQQLFRWRGESYEALSIRRGADE